jgi:hypothetical protein
MIDEETHVMYRCRLLGLALCALPSSTFAQTRVEGVNPADLLTQVQLTGEYNRLGNDVDQWTWVAKYDYRFAGTPFGINFEQPLFIDLDGPGFGTNGHGDLFARGRYIRSFGRWSLGLAFETTVPWGSDAFSSGRWQANPGVLAVYAWNQSDITAVVHKRIYGYIEGDDDMNDINQYQWRALQIKIWPTGWFGQIDISRFDDVRNGDGWFDSRVSLGKQYSATSRLQAELKKLSGDRTNDIALSLSWAVKL